MITVLIADDEWTERTFLRRSLEGRPDLFQVVGEASTGAQAVGLARQLAPDVLILDINMPQMGGLEAAQGIRAFAPDMVIILNSAYAEFSFAQQAILYDIDAYLIKPSQKEELIETILSCAQKRSRKSQPASPRWEAAFPQAQYPFDLTEKILQAIAQQRLSFGRELFSQLLAFLREHQGHILSYRLFLLNFIFSLQRELEKLSLPEAPRNLLDWQQALRRLESAQRYPDIYQAVESFGNRLFLVLETIMPARGSGGLGAAVRYIDQHFTQQITLEELSRIAFLSPSYLSRTFRQEHGESIRAYIIRRRMELAQELLLKTDLPIKEISQECGFNSLSRFYRSFRDFAGVTPLAFRKERHEAGT